MSDRLASSMTHEQFASIVGVTRQAIDDLAKRGVLRAGESGGQWLLAYTAKLREEAAGRSTELVLERARYDRARADYQEMVNAQKRRELVPVAMLEAVLADAARRIAGVLERTGARLKRETALDARARAIVEEELVQARNEAAALELPLDEIADAVRRREDEDGPVGDRPGGAPGAGAARGAASAAAQPVG